MHRILLFFLSLIVGVNVYAQTSVIPNLIGLTEADARDSLAAVGVTGNVHVDHTYGDEYQKKCTHEVDAGLVCAQLPVPDTEQLSELDVAFLVQKDRSSRPISSSMLHRIPGMGLSEVDARDRLTMEGFIGSVKTLEATSDEGCENVRTSIGHVCAITVGGELPPRHDVPANAPITLHVRTARSPDDAYGPIPEIKGLEITSALKALHDSGFPAYALTIVDQPGCAAMTICNQPNGGLHLRRSPQAEIRLAVGTGYGGKERGEPYLMPTLIGDDLATVLRKLDSLGNESLEVDRVMMIGGKMRLVAGRTFSACYNEQEVAGLEAGQVCEQRPVAGETVYGRAKITLYEGHRRLTEVQ